MHIPPIVPSFWLLVLACLTILDAAAASLAYMLRAHLIWSLHSALLLPSSYSKQQHMACLLFTLKCWPHSSLKFSLFGNKRAKNNREKSCGSTYNSPLITHLLGISVSRYRTMLEALTIITTFLSLSHVTIFKRLSIEIKKKKKITIQKLVYKGVAKLY